MPYIQVNEISMFYEKHGQGQPVVFIAGFGADHTVWNALVPYLTPYYQLIFFDNRGAGQTEVPEGPYTIEQMADDVVCLCRALEIKQAHFVGNSMGGFILQVLAYRYPQLVRSAVISHSPSSAKTPFKFFVESQLELLKAQASPSALIRGLCGWLFSFQFLSQPGMLEQLIRLSLENPYPFKVTGYEGQLAALKQFDSQDWLGEIQMPAFVMSSKQDLVFKASDVELLARQIAGAQYYCFLECGHLPQLEAPQLYAEKIREFIQSVCRN